MQFLIGYREIADALDGAGPTEAVALICEASRVVTGRIVEQ